MRFLSKVEAIHPRGHRAKTGVKKAKRGFSSSKGSSIKDRLDWIASSVHDLIEDYDFSSKTNKLLNDVSSLHGFITDSMDPEAQLLAYIKLATLTSSLGKEIKKLYAKGKLPETVDRQMVHKFLEMVGEVEGDRQVLAEAKELMEQVRIRLSKLGFV